MAKVYVATKHHGYIKVKGVRITVEGFPATHTLIAHESVNSGDSHPYTITHKESGYAFCKVHSKSTAKRVIQKKIEEYGGEAKLKRYLDKVAKKAQEKRWTPVFVRKG